MTNPGHVVCLHGIHCHYSLHVESKRLVECSRVSVVKKKDLELWRSILTFRFLGSFNEECYLSYRC